MAESTLNVVEESLVRKRIGDFLKARSAGRSPLGDAFSRIEANKWCAVIFGGVLRDLTILGPSEVPRDIDVVVDVPHSQLETVFSDLIFSKNRFGGLRLKSSNLTIDLWALENTWALRHEPTESLSFERLVRTTFLNVEAVAADVLSGRGQKRKIYSAGFFETIRRRIVDISFEPNPYPQLCVVRSLITALKLDWAVSKRLASYIVHQATLVSVQTLIDVQRSHYGKVRISGPRMQRYVETLEHMLMNSKAEALRMTATSERRVAKG